MHRGYNNSMRETREYNNRKKVNDMIIREITGLLNLKSDKINFDNNY